ncbi:hypothetical protein EG68_02883 [Paragonimus skrjabini miyazakii]|uniref:F-box domain-containing protein n=1 Tax=Paragonimus skrjabini miyazakii TaxID=59628 RepID=A0A8S9Z2L8_9TREM|nr:hypothetical protein EG68_02883 [Paragonimus skrjabini miyazakii]
MIGDTQQIHPPFMSTFNIAPTQLTTSGDEEKVFTNEDEQLKRWFSEFSDEQKRIILQDLLFLCRKEHLDQMEMSFRKKLEKIRCNFTNILPHNLILYLFSFCDSKTLVNLSQVSWFCKLLADSNEVWLEKCRQKGWNPPGSEWQLSMPPKFWKQYYIEKERMTSRHAPAKVLVLHMLEGTGRLRVGNRSPSPILGISHALLSVNASPRLPPNSTSNETNMKHTTVPIGRRFRSVLQPTRPREHYPISNNASPYYERLNLVPRGYFTGRESCQMSPGRLISLRARRIQSEQQRQLAQRFRVPWLPTSRTGLSRPHSSEAEQIRSRWTAVRQKYSLCRKTRSASMGCSQKPETATTGQDSDSIRYADVFGKPCTNDRGTDDQFSAWNYAVDWKTCRLNLTTHIDCNGRDPECTLPHRTVGSGTGNCSLEVTSTPASDVTNAHQLLRQPTEHLLPVPVIRQSENDDINPINTILARTQEMYTCEFVND